MQSQLLSSPSVELVSKGRECLHHYLSLSNAEESFMKQKSRNTWLNHEDQNTSFFHRTLSIRTARNSIRCLVNDGVRIEDTKAIKELDVNFFKKLLGPPSSKLNDVDIGKIDLFPVQIFSIHKDILRSLCLARKSRAFFSQSKMIKPLALMVFLLSFIESLGLY